MAESAHEPATKDERPNTSASAGAGAEGEGSIVVRFDGRSSAVLRIEARYPLKLLHLIRRHSQLDARDLNAALPRLPPYVPPVVQMLGYGGGLLSADRLSLHAQLLPHSALTLTTPAHGRAYKQRQPALSASTSSRPNDSRVGGIGGGSEVRHTFHLAAHSLLLFVPSPVSLFAHSSLAAHTTLHMHATASVLLLDAYTGGRPTQGERFGQAVYSSTTSVYYQHEDEAVGAGIAPIPALRDRSVLFGHQQLDDAATVGRYAARGSVLLLGPHLLPLAVQLFLAHNQRSVRKKAHSVQSNECVVSAAWVCGHAPELLPADRAVDSAAVQRCLSGGRVDGGCLLRLLSVEVEALLQTVGRLLAALDAQLQGVAPWQRV